MKPQVNPKIYTRQPRVWLLVVMILIVGMSMIWGTPHSARADGGGWPTATSTATQPPPPTPTLTPPPALQPTQGVQPVLPDSNAPAPAINDQANLTQTQQAPADNTSLILLVAVVLIIMVVGVSGYWFLFLRKPKNQ